MKSDGAQIRSYCYCLDCASAILKVLFSGEKGMAYNISNPNSIITIKEMAQILAKASGVKLRMEIPTEEEKKILVASGTIQPNEKNKKVLRAKTMELRTRLHLVQEVKKYIKDNGLDKTTQVNIIEEK